MTNFDLLGYFLVVFSVLVYIEIVESINYIISAVKDSIDDEKKNEIYERASTVVAVTVIVNFIFLLLVLLLTGWIHVIFSFSF